jgi:hypothetical protein
VKPISVIFLDFDGVLNSWPFKKARPPLPRPTKEMPLADLHDRSIDNLAIARLNIIVERTGAFVVVLSMWRIGMARADLRGILVRNGFKGTMLDKTPEHRQTRGHEIREWLTCTNRPIRSFVILDDEDDFAFFGRDRLVQTSYMDGGLLDEHVGPAVKILETPWVRS